MADNLPSTMSSPPPYTASMGGTITLPSNKLSAEEPALQNHVKDVSLPDVLVSTESPPKAQSSNEPSSGEPLPESSLPAKSLPTVRVEALKRLKKSLLLIVTLYEHKSAADLSIEPDTEVQYDFIELPREQHRSYTYSELFSDLCSMIEKYGGFKHADEDSDREFELYWKLYFRQSPTTTDPMSSLNINPNNWDGMRQLICAEESALLGLEVAYVRLIPKEKKASQENAAKKATQSTARATLPSSNHPPSDERPTLLTKPIPTVRLEALEHLKKSRLMTVTLHEEKSLIDWPINIDTIVHHDHIELPLYDIDECIYREMQSLVEKYGGSKQARKWYWSSKNHREFYFASRLHYSQGSRFVDHQVNKIFPTRDCNWKVLRELITAKEMDVVALEVIYVRKTAGRMKAQQEDTCCCVQ